MTHYLYLPIETRSLTARHKEAQATWINKKFPSKDLIEYCSGNKQLANLKTKDTINILIHGKPGKPPLISQINTCPNDLLSFFPRYSRHLRVTDGEMEVCIPGIATQMINDGLFEHDQSTFCIKLFFMDCNEQESRNLAKIFFEPILKHEKNQTKNIRVDYYPGDINRTQPNLSDAIDKHSLYNQKNSQPKLSLEYVKNALQKYNDYKSSRCYGLSGQLGLNGLFSSTESRKIIEIISESTIDETKRFAYARQFIALYPQNRLAKELREAVDLSLKLHNDNWDEHVTEKSTSINLPRSC